ncbi:MAG: hypothetical protein IH605_21420 [Burkholderiales bacterium]|nr:hypothetical protein [Burkholderiales bacterium]
MLGVIDELLREALVEALPAGTDVFAGQAVPALTGAKPRVSVAATPLVRRVPEGADESADARDPAFFTQRYTVAAKAAAPRNVTLPASASGQVAEVQYPPGRLLRPGDGYATEGRTVRFYRAPQGNVTVQTRGDRVRGYAEKHPCQVEIKLTCWAKVDGVSDTLTSAALAAVLARFAELDVIDLASGDGGLSMRILKPIARISSLERAAEAVGKDTWTRCSIQLTLCGELELVMALGAPEPEGIIERIEGEVVRGSQAPEPFASEGKKT